MTGRVAEHWYCDKWTGLLSSVIEILLMHKQLHWFCVECNKVVTDVIHKSSENNGGDGSTHADLVKDNSSTGWLSYQRGK